MYPFNESLLEHWATLTPEQASQQMSFVEGDMGWRYDVHNNNTMSAKQAEGVAYLCRLLFQHRVALLADEVGMGKTFQAIGIIRLLQQAKSNAKCLVIAPNKSICKQWCTEFEVFGQQHWHGKCSVDITIAQPESKLEAMIANVGEHQHHVYFTTIHALSGLTKEAEGGHRSELASEKARVLKSQVIEHLGEQGFDLLVIDEAHYLRTREGGSQKVAAAKAFFGEEEGATPLAQRVLLMTATPTHSSVHDVANILRYFVSEDELTDRHTQSVHDASQLLAKYGLRRLRLLQGKNGSHYAKQHYRKELAHPVSFAENQDAELFFGLYQRQLVKEYQAKGSNRQFLYGYLEGFESFGEHDRLSDVEDSEQPLNEHGKEAFSKAPDSDLLHSLSQEYYHCLNRFPEHPKYEALVNEFVPTQLNTQALDNIKHLVFVRRIPSVRELTKRVNAGYDNVLGKQLARVMNLDERAWQQNHWSRTWLNRNLVKSDVDIDVEDGEEELDVNDSTHDETHLRSRITELFVVKKRDAQALDETRNTECTNVGLRFRKPDSIFSLYLEPALDYWQEEYQYYFEHVTSERRRATYLTAAQNQRNEHHEYPVESELQDERVAQALPTIWQYLVEHLNEREQQEFQSWNARTKENFSHYFKAGVLFASPVMVELFCWFYEFDNNRELHRRGEGAYERYLDFIDYTKQKLHDSMLLWYFKAAIETFVTVCRKIAGTDLNEIGNDWRVLKGHTSPAAFASGEVSNRSSLQLSFNTPFYPNVLVATSVFQEGVNLHLQCNQIHHYGIAGNPGDHEQRVGRLDRLFSKVNRQYQKGQQGELRISFPYLEHSFDEDQLASFLERKNRAESKLDRCVFDDNDSRVGLGKSSQWQRYLKQPEIDSGKQVDDPYPAHF